jgi:hypothetical protein
MREMCDIIIIDAIMRVGLLMRAMRCVMMRVRALSVCVWVDARAMR